MKFQYEKRVTFEDVDLNYQLRIDVLAGLLQQVAALHSQNLGWGEEEVKALGMTWVLNTLKIEIIKYYLEASFAESYLQHGLAPCPGQVCWVGLFPLSF